MRNLAIASILVFSSVAAKAQPVAIDGDPARKLFAALMQADLKPTNITAPDPNFPGQTIVVDQKVTISNLECKLAYDQIGTLLGNCTLNDVTGAAKKLGSAASVQIYEAVPEQFADGGLGHFTASAKSVSCEIDTRKSDSTGTAVATCHLQ